MSSNNYSRGQLPTIVIAGRPNVGKSTLFNCLLGRRQAITDARAGVTRDYIEGELEIGTQRVRLVDTGGIGEADASFDKLVSKRSRLMLSEAAILLLMLDYSKYTPEDQELVEHCRKHHTCILVYNKADRQRKDPLLDRKMGYQYTLAISAAHRQGIDELLNMLAEILSKNTCSTDNEHVLWSDAACSIAILGRPNSGKSCLLNAILGYERSLVSDIAGTTRDSVDASLLYKGIALKFTDTAGLRRKSRVQDSLEYYANIRAISNAEHADVVLLLIDANFGLCDQDKKIAHVAIQSGRAVILILSKWDLVSDTELSARKSDIRFLFPQLRYAPIIACSAHTGYGIKSVIESALHSFQQLQQRIPTTVLNKHLAFWQQSLAASRKRVPAVRYATQTSSNPVRFLFFAKQKLTPAYQRYFINRIRQDLGFTKVPVLMDVRTGRK